MRNTATLRIVALLCVFAACQGPIGPAGPGTKLVFTGQLDGNGQALVVLPPEAGSLESPPVVSVYTSKDLTGPFYL